MIPPSKVTSLYQKTFHNKINFQVYDGFSNNVTTIGFQKDCKWIYSSSEDGNIRICDLRVQGFQRQYYNKEPMNCVVLHPNEVKSIYFFYSFFQGELIAGDQQGIEANKLL